MPRFVGGCRFFGSWHRLGVDFVSVAAAVVTSEKKKKKKKKKKSSERQRKEEDKKDSLPFASFFHTNDAFFAILD